MKDLIDFSKETGAGPMDSLISFPRRSSSGLHTQQPQQSEQLQTVTPNANPNESSNIHTTSMPVSAVSNDAVGMNNSLNASSTSGPSATVIALQNSMNAGPENQMDTLGSSAHAGSSIPIPSASPSNSVPLSQPNPLAFSSMKAACSNNLVPASQNALRLNSNSPASLPTMQQPNDPNDSQSSVQQILQELMMSSQLNGVGSLGNDVKPINGMASNMNGANCLLGNGMMPNNSAIGGVGNFTSMCGTGLPPAASGIQATMANNAMVMNGRAGMNHLQQDPTAMNCQPQDINNRLLDRFGAVNSFNNLQFDWKSPP